MRVKDKLYEIQINGFNQYYTVRTNDRSKPILLFLHGGPGGANIALASLSEKRTELTDYFTMVQYDQRGAGKSFDPSMTTNDLSVNKLFEDTKIMINHLLKQLDHSKLFVVGHSWGTILGLKLCKDIPNLLYGYVGISQLIRIKESELAFTEEALTIAKSKKKTKFIESLEKSLVHFHKGQYPDYIINQRDVVARMGLLTHKVRPMNPKILFVINSLSPHYSKKDTKYFEEGMLVSTKAMWHEIMSLDLSKEIDELRIPIMLINGISDRIASVQIADQYIERLQAPKKELVIFNESGHMPQVEQKKLYESNIIRFMDEIMVIDSKI